MKKKLKQQISIENMYFILEKCPPCIMEIVCM